MKIKISGAVGAIFLAAIFAGVIAGFYGWVANIIAFVNMLDGGVTAMFIARIVGIFFAPLGAVLGYF
jgi:hypothetical protein